MLIRWSPLHGYVHVLSLETLDRNKIDVPRRNAVGTLHIEVFHHGELIRSECGPAVKLKHALIDPEGRYRVTPELLDAACINPDNVEAIVALKAFLFPSSHYAQVLEHALENLQERLNRGGDLEKCLDDVSSLYGVQVSDLETEYTTLYA